MTNSAKRFQVTSLYQPATRRELYTVVDTQSMNAPVAPSTYRLNHAIRTAVQWNDRVEALDIVWPTVDPDAPPFTGDLADLADTERSVFPGVTNVVSTVTGKHVGHAVRVDKGYVAYLAEGEAGDWELGFYGWLTDAYLAILPHAPVL